MYNLHDELNEFYQTHVRLGKKRRDELALFRDNSLKRLKSGLEALGFPYLAETRNQGGYAMHTLNQAPDNNYDIDVATIFERTDLPTDARKARERIRNAFIKTGGQFKDTPSARENAVTVWYSEGQHLDFAVYRYSYHPVLGHRIIEHASGDEWKARDPDAVTSWFKGRVDTLSPSTLLCAVEQGQLRKIVRFVKYLSKSRAAWALPGGMITTALVVECYQQDASRDDIALLRTLEVLNNRLKISTVVPNPIGGSDLAAREDHKKEVENLRDVLSNLMPKLGVLYSANCTYGQARSAWRQFFNHEFWNAKEEPVAKASLLSIAAAPASGLTFPDRPRVPTKPQGFG